MFNFLANRAAVGSNRQPASLAALFREEPINALPCDRRGWYGRFIQTREREAKPARTQQPVQPAAIEATIEAATFILREPDEAGHRIAVNSPGLGGWWLYDCDTAERRIRKFFPEATDGQVDRAVRHLESKIRIFTKPVDHAKRNTSSWVHRWRD